MMPQQYHLWVTSLHQGCPCLGVGSSGGQITSGWVMDAQNQGFPIPGMNLAALLKLMATLYLLDCLY